MNDTLGHSIGDRVLK
ncbi:hypothetical protein ACT453_05340, partial [Bacillus sp. D-CC]